MEVYSAFRGHKFGLLKNIPFSSIARSHFAGKDRRSGLPKNSLVSCTTRSIIDQSQTHFTFSSFRAQPVVQESATKGILQRLPVGHLHSFGFKIISKLYLKNISPTELEKEIMIKDVLFLANGPEKENTRDTTDKVMRNEKVDEDATGNENVIEDVKEKCNKKENMNEQTNSRGELNVKEKELLMEREVFDETYIKRFNTYVDCSSPPRHIFDKHIRDSGNLISLY
ncbi:PREDICTED: uncharacterized protein LOC109241573 [Nicotiana attenuata]|uniref:uncharacterized protein LOC109241573 n=1 Tax=Nicotiana attenuata TaxID=49451 RepID=UPI0009045F2F|nr:PREDICTED: uncharacterized protein LOC109241573 [Nicotiana attenuata]